MNHGWSLEWNSYLDWVADCVVQHRIGAMGSGMTLDLRDVANDLLQLTLNPRDTVILDETIRRSIRTSVEISYHII